MGKSSIANHFSKKKVRVRLSASVKKIMEISMFEKQAAFSMIQDSLDGLNRANTIKTRIEAKPELVLMGSGADENIDSLGFVTLIMDIEDRLEKVTDYETPIVLTDILGFDVNNPALTVNSLANHMVIISKKVISKRG